MFKKLGRSIASGKTGLKFKFDVEVLQLENLPSAVKSCRIVWSRGAKVQMTGIVGVKNGVAVFRQQMSQMATMYKDAHNNFEGKEYNFKVQVPGKGNDDKMLTVGKGDLDLARYVNIKDTAQNAMLPIVFKVGPQTTGYLKILITSELLKEAVTDEEMTEVSGMTGITSAVPGYEQDLSGFDELSGGSNRKLDLRTQQNSPSLTISTRSLPESQGSVQRITEEDDGEISPMATTLTPEEDLKSQSLSDGKQKKGRQGSQPPSLQTSEDLKNAREALFQTAKRGSAGAVPDPKNSPTSSPTTRPPQVPPETANGSAVAPVVPASSTPTKPPKPERRLNSVTRTEVPLAVPVALAPDKPAPAKEAKQSDSEAAMMVERLNAQLQAAQAQALTSTHQCKEAEEKVRVLTEEKAALTKAVEQLELRMKEVQDGIQTDAYRAHLEAQVEDLASQLRLVKQQVVQLEAAKLAADKEAASLQRQLEQQEEDRHELEEQLQRQLEEVGDDVSQEVVARYEAKYNRLKTRYRELDESTRGEIEEYQVSLKAAQDQCAALQEKLQELENISQKASQGEQILVEAREQSHMALASLSHLQAENHSLMQDLVRCKLELAQVQEREVILKRELYKAKETTMKLASKMTKLETLVYTKSKKGGR